MKRPPSISSKRDFEKALRSGSRSRTPFGTIFVASGPDPDAPARLGLAVPSRVGGAVVRNRIKRRLRASFVAARPRAGLDIVVRAGRPALSLRFQEMERAFAELGEAK